MLMISYVLQLKNPSSVAINIENGERAMLIKDHDGDWCIVFGRWTGFRRGVPGTPGMF